jgi:hypothetical protein
MVNNIQLSYLGQDFASFNDSFVNTLKAYYPSTWRDFSEGSTSQALLDVLAGSSDMLSFYMNRIFNELDPDRAIQKESAYRMARILGYKIPNKAASLVEQAFYINVPAEYTTGIPLPNYRYAPVLKRGSRILANNGTKFETLYDIDFTTATGSDAYRPSQVNTATGVVEYFALQNAVLALSAETKKKTFNINDFVRYRKLVIDDADSIDIFDTIDVSGNRWYEVEYLPQDTVFEASVNTNYDSTLVPYVLKLKRVPRRFVKDFDHNTGYMSMNFGSGKESTDDDTIVPNTSEMSIPLYGKPYFAGVSIDPQRLVNSKTLGIAPSNTVLDVFYRAGGGASSVVPSNTIKKVDNALIEFKYTGLDDNIKSSVITSLATNNAQPSQGGRDEQTLFEIKQYAKANFAAQDRCVTADDYVARLFSLPSVFGSICKANISKNCRSPNIIDISVLSYDSNKNYSEPTDTLKQNMKTYLKRYNLLTDTVYMSTANVINFIVNFRIVANPNSNRNTILALCMNFFKGYFNKDIRGIGEPIIKSEVIRGLQNIEGVYSVGSITYTFTDSSIIDSEDSGIITCPSSSIFELANVSTDIIGVIL